MGYVCKFCLYNAVDMTSNIPLNSLNFILIFLQLFLKCEEWKDNREIFGCNTKGVKTKLRLLCSNAKIKAGTQEALTIDGDTSPRVWVFRGGKFWVFDNKIAKKKPLGELLEGSKIAADLWDGIHFPGGAGFDGPNFIMVYKKKWSRWTLDDANATLDGEGDNDWLNNYKKKAPKNFGPQEGKGEPTKGDVDKPIDPSEKSPNDKKKIKPKDKSKTDQGQEPDDSDLKGDKRKRPKEEEPKGGPKDKQKIKNKPKEKGEGSDGEPEEGTEGPQGPGGDKMKIKNKPKDKDGDESGGEPEDEGPTDGKKGPKDQMKIKNKPNEKESDGSGEEPGEGTDGPGGDKMKIKNKPKEKGGDGSGGEPEEGTEGPEGDNSEVPNKGEPKDGSKDKMKIKNKPNEKDGSGEDAQPVDPSNPDGKPEGGPNEKWKIKHKPNETDGDGIETKKPRDVYEQKIGDETEELPKFKVGTDGDSALIRTNVKRNRLSKVIGEEICHYTFRDNKCYQKGNCTNVSADRNNFPAHIVAAIQAKDKYWYFINKEGEYCKRRMTDVSTEVSFY